MLLSLNMDHSPDVILDEGLHVTFRAVYDHQGLVPCLLGSGRAQLPLQGLDGGIFGIQNVLKSRKPPVSSCCYWEELAKLKLEPRVSGWHWQLWSDPGWRWRAQCTAALLSSAVFFSSDIFLRCSSRMVSVCVVSSSSCSRSSCRNVQVNIWRLHQ